MPAYIQDIPNFYDRYLSTEKAKNALSKQELENKYYAPNIQSEIDNRNALTKGQNIHNQYLPDEYRIANELNQQKFDWNPRNWASENASRNALTNKTNQMLPGELEEQRIKNRYLPQSEQAEIAYKNMGGGRGSVAQKDVAAFEMQLQNDNPKKPEETPDQYNQRISELSDAYGQGSNMTASGIPVPKMSWRAQQLQNNVMNRNVPVAARNQLINMDTLVNDMKDFDIDAVSDFAGPQGKVRLGEAKAKMALNPNDPSIDPMARRYLSAMKQAVVNMDQMRKAFGTSVIPEYVYNTIGRLTNPNDSIWLDKTQVKKAYNDIVRTMSKNRELLRSKYRQGINSSSDDNGSSDVQRWGRDANGRPVRI